MPEQPESAIAKFLLLQMKGGGRLELGDLNVLKLTVFAKLL
jgi:hypothetical protein